MTNDRLWGVNDSPAPQAVEYEDCRGYVLWRYILIAKRFRIIVLPTPHPM